MIPIYKETYTHYTSKNGNTQLFLYRRKRTRNKAKNYFIMQKLSGLTMVLIGLASPIACDSDGTFLLFALPIGIYLLLTRNKVMTF